ncbi:putative dimethylallyl tryptophan synthase 1 [Diaporthe ampelina]|uniref:Putative dimethylallyl tryptophan synthase 1 n=1 Tax=Diaporthe ampelina TaxID=1214573 RepID=A0A0G2HR82_9PEZI|nr:putative dimethylallyl tryptophan synthase 1 [Diaporthe ampelina]
MNGTNGNGIVNDPKPSTHAWQTLSQYLPPRDHDSDFWWNLTGRHLAGIVEAAGYSLDKQYEALLMHYHWTNWTSQLQHDGAPIEYSWKWNTSKPNDKPRIRYAIEPIGPRAGTESDPLNHDSLREIISSLKAVVPGVDTTWSNYFWSALYDRDNHRYMEERAAGARLTTSTMMCTELSTTDEEPLEFKTYFSPRHHDQPIFLDLDNWEKALKGLDPHNEARDKLLDYLRTSEEGQLMKPLTVAVDNVKPEHSRLKWYFWSPKTNFAAVRDIMTLGGRIPASAKQKAGLDDLYELIRAATSLPADHPETSEIRPPSGPGADAVEKNGGVPFGKEPEQEAALSEGDNLEDMFKGHWYYFDIAPGKSVPEVKIYVQLRVNGRDDLAIARGVCSWMESHGRGAYCGRYQKMLDDSIATHRHLNGSTGIQTFLACQFKEGKDMDVTSYFGPEAFHEARKAASDGPRRRGLLRRDE